VVVGGNFACCGHCLVHVINVIKYTVMKDGFVCLRCDRNMFQNSVIAVIEHRCSKKMSFGPFPVTLKDWLMNDQTIHCEQIPNIVNIDLSVYL